MNATLLSILGSWKIFSLVAMLFITTSSVYAQDVITDNRITQSNDSVPKRIHSSELLREKLSFSFGAYYGEGDYGTDKATNSFSLPFRLSYSRKDWRFSAKIPYVYIDGPANVLAIRDGAEFIEKFAEGERQIWGNGDLRLSAQHQLFNSPKGKSSAYAGIAVKVPIASEEDSLGSGEFDHSFFTGGYYRLGHWLANGRLGYQLMGDTNETNYNDRWYASLGGVYRFDRQISAGFNLYQKQKLVETSDSIRTLSAYFNLRMNRGWRASFSMGTGFTEASSDLFAGVQFTKSFVRKRRIMSDD